MMNSPQTQTAAAELRRRYAVEYDGVLVALAAIRDRLETEYPPVGDGAAPVTRYDLDAVRALRSELLALLERG